MSQLVISPATQKSLDDFLKAPSHALMLTGPAGSGKSSIAIQLASSILSIDNFEGYAYKLHLNDDKLGIEAVRGLESFLKLKVPRASAFNRAVIIENAHNLTIEAQNALLKTLEEPPEATIIVLTTSLAQNLLPTVRSRTQLIDIKKPDKQAIRAFFKSYDDKQFAQAYAISGGLPGLMQALLEQTDHPLLQATEQARRLLKSSAYERLHMVDSLAKQRQLAIDTAFILQQMAHVSLQTAEGKVAMRWQTILETSFEAANALSINAQPKLALTALALAL